jgi:hypothetical protein
LVLFGATNTAAIADGMDDEKNGFRPTTPVLVVVASAAETTDNVVGIFNTLAAEGAGMVPDEAGASPEPPTLDGYIDDLAAIVSAFNQGSGQASLPASGQTVAVPANTTGITLPSYSYEDLLSALVAVEELDPYVEIQLPEGVDIPTAQARSSKASSNRVCIGLGKNDDGSPSLRPIDCGGSEQTPDPRKKVLTIDLDPSDAILLAGDGFTAFVAFPESGATTEVPNNSSGVDAETNADGDLVVNVTPYLFVGDAYVGIGDSFKQDRVAIRLFRQGGRLPAENNHPAYLGSGATVEGGVLTFTIPAADLKEAEFYPGTGNIYKIMIVLLNSGGLESNFYLPKDKLLSQLSGVDAALRIRMADQLDDNPLEGQPQQDGVPFDPASAYPYTPVVVGSNPMAGDGFTAFVAFPESDATTEVPINSSGVGVETNAYGELVVNVTPYLFVGDAYVGIGDSFKQDRVAIRLIGQGAKLPAENNHPAYLGSGATVEGGVLTFTIPAADLEAAQFYTATGNIYKISIHLLNSGGLESNFYLPKDKLLSQLSGEGEGAGAALRIRMADQLDDNPLEGQQQQGEDPFAFDPASAYPWTPVVVGSNPMAGDGFTAFVAFPESDATTDVPINSSGVGAETNADGDLVVNVTPYLFVGDAYVPIGDSLFRPDRVAIRLIGQDAKLPHENNDRAYIGNDDKNKNGVLTFTIPAGDLEDAQFYPGTGNIYKISIHLFNSGGLESNFYLPKDKLLSQSSGVGGGAALRIRMADQLDDNPLEGQPQQGEDPFAFDPASAYPWTPVVVGSKLEELFQEVNELTYNTDFNQFVCEAVLPNDTSPRLRWNKQEKGASYAVFLSDPTPVVDLVASFKYDISDSCARAQPRFVFVRDDNSIVQHFKLEANTKGTGELVFDGATENLTGNVKTIRMIIDTGSAEDANNYGCQFYLHDVKLSRYVDNEPVLFFDRFLQDPSAASYDQVCLDPQNPLGPAGDAAQ